MTEEDAKTKWCPFARVITTNLKSAGNRLFMWGTPEMPAQPAYKPAALEMHGSKCLGSACMAWRVVTVNELSEVVFAGTREGKPGTGYCGLAGKP